MATEFEIEVLKRLTKIEEVLLISQPEPAKPTGGLYDFVRPVPVEPRHGAGVRMNAPDAEEALLRAKYAVRWNGDVALTDAVEEEVWAEIEDLKAGDQKLIEKYRMLDPAFAGFALLTALLDVSKYDRFLGQGKRDSWAGTTVADFINLQFNVDSLPSGDE